MDAKALKVGSSFHKARLFPNGFMITLADDTAAGRARFQEIVERAQIELPAQGYSVEPQLSTSFSGWDMAIITNTACWLETLDDDPLICGE